jgi:uncharacterized protein YraI
MVEKSSRRPLESDSGTKEREKSSRSCRFETPFLDIFREKMEIAMPIRPASPLVAALLSLVAVSAMAAPSVATDFSKMRSGPGAKWPVIAEIPAGAKVQLDNCGPGWKRDWCQVHYKGKMGFVPANTLEPTARNVVVAPLVTRDITAVRSGPGNKWNVIGKIPPGRKVAASACQKGWMTSWCRVTYEGKSGYVDRNFLKRKGAVFAR